MALARSEPPRDITLGLPNELLLEFLAYLAQPHLLVAARISQRWRALARTLPNFYRFHNFVYPGSTSSSSAHDFERLRQPPLNQPSSDSELAALECIIDDVVQSGYNLSLRIHIDTCNPSAFYEIDEDEHPVIANERRHLRQAVIPLVRRAASRLVALAMTVVTPFAGILFEALRVPAHCLRELRISLFGHDGRVVDVRFELPEILFDGNSPCLSILHLGNVTPSLSGPPLYAVRDLTLHYGCQKESLTDVHAYCPNVRHLVIDRLAHCGPFPLDSLAASSQLKSLTLGYYHPEFDTMSPGFSKVRAIPVVEFIDYWPVNFTEYSVVDDGPVQLLLAEHFSTTIPDSLGPPRYADRFGRLCAALTFGSPESEWCTRRIVRNVRGTVIFGHLASSNIARNLVAVEIDDRHVRAFIRELGQLPQLASLTIVLIKWANVRIRQAGVLDPVLTRGNEQISYCGSNFFAEEVYGDWETLAAAAMSYPALRTLALRSSFVGSFISAEILQLLVWLCPRSSLHLELWHGLSIVGDDVPAFASISSFGTPEPPSETVVRAAPLFQNEYEDFDYIYPRYC
ncbi:hypothetical protein AURDEDRAFT_120415 [Auricularia subglabra TFB-10046 SS5]|nr:hypothetical protein AURDEDRAFT_120415 [Auricularia subglabra TFB-10046 SS5]